jgi:hypothetical protein
MTPSSIAAITLPTSMPNGTDNTVHASRSSHALILSPQPSPIYSAICNWSRSVAERLKRRTSPARRRGKASCRRAILGGPQLVDGMAEHTRECQQSVVCPARHGPIAHSFEATGLKVEERLVPTR